MLQIQEQLRHVEVLLKHVEPLPFTRSLLYFHTCSMGDTERSHQAPLADLQSKTPIVLNGQLGCWHISWALLLLRKDMFWNTFCFCFCLFFRVDESPIQVAVCILPKPRIVCLSVHLHCPDGFCVSQRYLLLLLQGHLFSFCILYWTYLIYVFLCFLYISLLGNVTLLPFSDQQVASLSFCALFVAQFRPQSLHRNSTRSHCIPHSFWVRCVFSLSLSPSKLEQIVWLIYFM